MSAACASLGVILRPISADPVFVRPECGSVTGAFSNAGGALAYFGDVDAK